MQGSGNDGGVLDLGADRPASARRAGRLKTMGWIAGAIVAGMLLGLLVIEIFPPGGRGKAQFAAPLPESRPAELPRIVTGRAGAEAPLVVIDAGHGGFDPGASGPSGAIEKDVALAIAAGLRDRLVDLGAVRVALTREDDVFLPLEERVAMAEALKADLFISIHADSAPVEEARGANVYVLSGRASDREALALARSVNGDNDAYADDSGDEVEALLAELARRETALGSASIARTVEARVKGRLPVHGRFVRGGNLVVLRSAQMPSILFEAGYISSEEDATRLTSEEGRAAIVSALAEAIVADLLAPRRG